jgi:hypothetical protein
VLCCLPVRSVLFEGWCQRKDWKGAEQENLQASLNVGHGGMQVRTDTHTSRLNEGREVFETDQRNLDKEDKRFFKLFEETTFEGSRAAAPKMKEIVKRQSKENQKSLLFYNLRLLVRSSNSKMLSWPSSPLLVLLQLIDPDLLSGDEDASLREGESRETSLQRCK